MAILGDFTSGCSMAAAPVCDEAGIVLLAPTGSNAAFAPMSDYAFSTHKLMTCVFVLMPIMVMGTSQPAPRMLLSLRRSRYCAAGSNRLQRGICPHE